VNIKETLDLHRKWLNGEDGGVQAVLRNANLRSADLCNANLRYANLRSADLRSADLRSANIDYSAWPLWCGSLGVKTDGRIARQLLYHALDVVLNCDDDALKAAVSKRLLSEANKSHVVTEYECAPLTKEATS